MFAPELANNWNITVSQGSAATSLRCGGICNDQFVANSVLSLAVKESWKSINIPQSYQRVGCRVLFDSQSTTTTTTTTTRQLLHY